MFRSFLFIYFMYFWFLFLMFHCWCYLFMEVKFTNKIVRYLKYTMWWFGIYMYTLWKDFPIQLLTCPYIISHIYFCVCVLGNIFQFCSHSKFQLHNAALSIIVTMLFITYSDLVYLNNWKFVLFIPPPIASSACLLPIGNHFATLFLWVVSIFFFFFTFHM